MVFGIILLILLVFILLKTGALWAVLDWIVRGIADLIAGALGFLWNQLLLPLLGGIWSLLLRFVGATWPFLLAGAVFVALVCAIRSLLGFQSSFGGSSSASDSWGGYYSGPAYVGNRKSKVLHTPYSDGASMTSEKHRVEFSSLSEAESKGYHLRRDP